MIAWRRKPPVLILSAKLGLPQPITPVSSNHGGHELPQTSLGIKRAAMRRPVALAASPPQKDVSACEETRDLAQICGIFGTTRIHQGFQRVLVRKD
ncbi:MAG: hypothetical protein JNL84_07165 [Candidatus Accumulibacter sp.]|nr:hypothetical protein [Accumulibacter sp.]